LEIVKLTAVAAAIGCTTKPKPMQHVINYNWALFGKLGLYG